RKRIMPKATFEEQERVIDSVKKVVLLLLLYTTTLIATDDITVSDNYISTLKQKQFNYDYEKNSEQSSLLENSWIAPLNLSYSYSKTNPYGDVQINQMGAITIDQPIFQSGGIYYGIKYAQATKKYSDYSVDVAKLKMIKDTIALLMQIKQSEFRIERQKLQIENSEINLAQKKEQYLSGQLDSGFLDTAIIERNFKTQALYDMQTSKERLVSNFTTMSDLSYKELTIPHLELLSKEQFLKYNISLKMAKAKLKRDNLNQDVTFAKYLPRVTLTGGYYWTKNENRTMKIGASERDYYNYGFRVNMPININSFQDIEVSKIEFMKSALLKEDRVLTLNSMFEQVMQNISNFEKKQILSLENIELYSKLLKDTKKLFNAGYKTQYDVDTLQNSLKISELDSKIFEIDKQLELLTLYEIYVNDGSKR
ncbi:MAG: TolC family protein, partial [Campylobacterota bacterium]|nr:TolC family protein [Campylobacterota bacterium]